jgi:hypothetical protein
MRTSNRELGRLITNNSAQRLPFIWHGTQKRLEILDRSVFGYDRESGLSCVMLAHDSHSPVVPLCCAPGPPSLVHHVARIPLGAQGRV